MKTGRKDFTRKNREKRLMGLVREDGGRGIMMKDVRRETSDLKEEINRKLGQT